MEKKKSKGFFSVLFAPKSGSGCCNVQFEEIPEEKILAEVQNVDHFEDNNDNSKEPAKKKK